MPELKLTFKSRSSYRFFSRIIIFSLVCSNLAFAEGDKCRRIISLAPSISEIVAALGLEDQLVAVSRYCLYPASLQKLPRVGGLLDPNLEMIFALKPSVVFALHEQAQSISNLEKLKIESVIVKHDGVANILESIRRLGEICGVQARGQELTLQLEAAVSAARERSRKRGLRRVMLAVSNDGQIDFKSLYISGSDGFYSDLLKILGAVNVFESKTSAIGSVSSEALLGLNPDTIIIINSGSKRVVRSQNELLSLWSDFAGIDAVKRKRLFLLSEDYSSIPGPRFVKLLADLESVLNQAEDINA